tara:strand:+ start:101 stop:544 length:444 start_codon:yes stop_codon:yes gene_type:complete
MSGQFWLVKNKEQLQERLVFFSDWVIENWDWEKPLTWKAEPYDPKRSLDQNALMHVWMREIATHFSAKMPVTTDEIKTLMKYKFLGTRDIVVGSTVIAGQVVETSSLKKGEMMRFMDEVYDWANDHGVRLSNPKDSEYMKLRQRQNE